MTDTTAIQHADGTTTLADVQRNRTLAADLQTARLAALVDGPTLTALVRGIDRAVAHRLHGHSGEDSARAEALARALQAHHEQGQPVADAIRMAVRLAVADTLRDAADVSLLSLDVTSADGSTTLADMLETGDVLESSTGAGTARLSHHDDGNGGYRGVARVPVPLDIFRPLIPSPEETAEAARAALTPEAQRLLRVTVAVNRAAEAQDAEHIEWLAALTHTDRQVERTVHRQDAHGVHHTVVVSTFPSWLAIDARHNPAARAVLKEAQAALRNARRAHRTDANPHRPRTAEVAAVILGADVKRGRATTALAAQQTAAWSAYTAQRAAIVRAALEAHTERLNDSADRQRAAFRLHPHAAALAARALAPAKRIGAMSASALPFLVAASRRRYPTAPREWRTVVARGTRQAARQAASSRAAGHTLACPVDTAVRPSRGLQGWHAAFPLPGSARRRSADVTATALAERSRSHADETAPRAPRNAAQMAPSTLPRTHVPGPCAATPHRAPVAPQALGAAFLAECDRRRAIVAAVRSFTGTRAAWRTAFAATA